MFIFKISFRNLTRHKKRNFVIASIIAIAVFLYLISDSLVVGLEDLSYTNVIELQTGHIQLAGQHYWENKEDFDLDHLTVFSPSRLKKVNQIDQVIAISPEFRFQAKLNNGIDEIPIIGKGIDPEQFQAVLTVNDYLREGKMITTGENQALIGASLAQLMDFSLHDYLTLLIKTDTGTYNTIDAEIVGIIDSPHPEVNSNTVFVPLDIAQKAHNVDDAMTLVKLKLTHRSKTDEIVQQINQNIRKESDPWQAYSWMEAAETVIAMNRAQKGENAVILGIFLLIGIIGIINTVILSALERTREIGMMKAMGMREWEIVMTFVLESGGIGLLGGFMGSALGAIGVALQTRYGYNMVGMLDEQTINDYGLPVMGRIYGGWNPQTFLFIFLLVIIIAMIAGFFPALWASRKDPVKAIYHR